MRTLIFFLTSLSFCSHAQEKACSWEDWEQFKSSYVIDDGRVVDGSDERSITTSEGQSYALFFALIANDKNSFDELYGWTQSYLAKGDLTGHLPAWLWGNHDQKAIVLDDNSASDSDLWIAYTLIEAGRLWDDTYYSNVGYFLAMRIMREETISYPEGKRQLLPAPYGFVFEDGSSKLNPSYLPLFILRRFSTGFTDVRWTELQNSSVELLSMTQNKGFSPDWVKYDGESVDYDKTVTAIGSYNAIRTYLWAGMLHPEDPNFSILIKSLQPMLEATKNNRNIAPLTVDTSNGEYSGNGPIGFSASLIPLAVASGERELAEALYKNVQSELRINTQDHYYNNVLSLFAKGWFEDRYKFSPDGKLVPKWKQEQCQ
ncbi:cellulase [Vibrio sp. ZSDZ34]|uniref:cellulase n=1 Tax=Vibrio gelatinilyticus TaxID=2893468 RepID=A0A9X2AVN6_9VIBR|nr:cellulose synthase complex periplasmic endoglucanase BcsZ [Vibrio gelatinilyticus]MCJ2376525.1 cellulase [Vibrio gelatinilyticus]